MANVFKILRSIVAGVRPSGRAYGEPYVNFADNQFGVFDSGNNVRDLIGVPFFSSAAAYAANNPVNYQGQLYSAKAAVPAGVWNASQWNIIGGGVPTGSVMLFWQSAAPTGWTQVTTHNDKVLRVVSGTGGVAGGTNSFSSVMAQTVVGTHTISLAELISHNHTVGGGYHNALMFNVPGGGGTAMPGGSGGGTGELDANGGSSGHTHTITLGIQYIDIILATKN